MKMPKFGKTAKKLGRKAKKVAKVGFKVGVALAAGEDPDLELSDDGGFSSGAESEGDSPKEESHKSTFSLVRKGAKKLLKKEAPKPKTEFTGEDLETLQQFLNWDQYWKSKTHNILKSCPDGIANMRELTTLFKSVPLDALQKIVTLRPENKAGCCCNLFKPGRRDQSTTDFYNCIRNASDIEPIKQHIETAKLTSEAIPLLKS